MTWGRLRMSTRPCVAKARIKRLNVSLAAEKTRPPTLPDGETRPTPRLPSPWKPTMPGPWIGLLPRGEVVLKLNPGLAAGLRVLLTITPLAVKGVAKLE